MGGTRVLSGVGPKLDSLSLSPPLLAHLSAEDDALCICSHARVLGNHRFEFSHCCGWLHGVRVGFAVQRLNLRSPVVIERRASMCKHARSTRSTRRSRKTEGGVNGSRLMPRSRVGESGVPSHLELDAWRVRRPACFLLICARHRTVLGAPANFSPTLFPRARRQRGGRGNMRQPAAAGS